MPFEVYPIKGPGIDKENHAMNDVAEEIRTVYEDVAAKGGKIIAQHTLRVAFGLGGRYVQEYGERLFLVAEVPQQNGQPTTR